MKILSFLLILSLSLNSFAATGSLSELERVIDEYQYSVSVEWDQKDQAAFDELNLAFVKSAKQILSQSSLTREEILQLAEKRLGGKKEFEALKLKMNLRKAPTSDEETVALVQEISKDFYQKGASWNGNVVLTVGIVVGIIAAFVALNYLLQSMATHKCVELGPRTRVCEWGYGEHRQETEYGRYCWYEQDCLRSEPIQK